MSQLQIQEQPSGIGIELNPLPSPRQLKERYAVSEDLMSQVQTHRNEVEQIVSGKDERFLVIVGPCSLHCDDGTLEYARRLAILAEQLRDKVMIVMRAYLEKPRTTVGWKGMLYDPGMDGSDDISLGLSSSRKLLIRLLELGLPLATEMLNPLASPYLDDVFSWVAIGARTTESQTHRELASALPCAVGFKNGTDGGLDVAINALLSASQPHSFLSMCQDGRVHQVRSSGNTFGQLVLRGGRQGPNYDALHVANAKKLLANAGLYPSLIVDCSHENSSKDHTRQSVVAQSVLDQRRDGCSAVKGLMLESFLQEGRQDISRSMTFGQSVTDACIGWEETSSLLKRLHASL